MRQSDYKRLEDLERYLFNGGLPDLGKPHQKAGYRFCIGWADYGSGKPQPWRENLGRNKLLAQYRAREMCNVWITHVQDHEVYALFAPIETIHIPPLNREAA